MEKEELSIFLYMEWTSQRDNIGNALKRISTQWRASEEFYRTNICINTTSTCQSLSLRDQIRVDLILSIKVTIHVVSEKFVVEPRFERIA